MSPLAPADDLRHRVAPGAKGRDSLFWTLVLPEHDLAAQVYTWVDHNHYAGRQVAVYGPGAGDEVLDVEAGLKLDEGADFDAWDVAGLTASHPEPLRVAEVGFRSDEVELDYRFEGTHEAFSYAQNRDGCPPWMAIDRFEQAGRATGVLRLRGREIPFDVPAHRDHSWGRRDWRYPQHWKWLCAQGEDGTSLNALLWIARGEPGVNGYVLRDGRVVGLVDARAHAEYDDELRQTTLETDLVDEDGRTTRLTMERFAVFRQPFSTDSVITEAACRCTIDGVPGSAQFETLWPGTYVETMTGGGR